MVAIGLVSIVLVAVFTFMTAMSNFFYAQEMIVDTQSNLRFALDVVARDVRRAGYLSSPHAVSDPRVCPKPSAPRVPIQAVSYHNKASAGQIFGANVDIGNLNIEPDSLLIVGSLDVPDMFVVDDLSRAGRLTLDSDSVSSILAGGSSGDNEALFNNLFVRNRLVRISDLVGGFSQFGVVTGADFNGGTPQVAVAGIFFRDNDRGCGFEGVSGQGLELAVLNIIQYSLELDPNIETKTNLVRTELDARGQPMVLEGTTLRNSVAVLDYAVDLQVLAHGHSGAPALAPTLLADTSVGNDDGSVSYRTLNPSDSALISAPSTSQQWHRIRSVQLIIAARTSREDINLNHFPRSKVVSAGASIYDTMTSFNLDADSSTAAHVITMSTQIEIANNSIANLNF
jgi:hypothetical protein